MGLSVCESGAPGPVSVSTYSGPAPPRLHLTHPSWPLCLPRNLRQIFQSLPPFVDILLLLFFFMIIFAILGESPVPQAQAVSESKVTGGEKCTWKFRQVLQML